MRCAHVIITFIIWRRYNLSIRLSGCLRFQLLLYFCSCFVTGAFYLAVREVVVVIVAGGTGTIFDLMQMRKDVSGRGNGLGAMNRWVGLSIHVRLK